ncbi:MAG: hypothetical protein RLZ63_359 [Pseudomonadota bacterium]|jgi:hypothetical protein
MEVIVVIGIVGILYFLPSIVAAYRNHPNVAGILILNVFLGWTLLGWVGALIWSTLALPKITVTQTKD